MKKFLLLIILFLATTGVANATSIYYGGTEFSPGYGLSTDLGGATVEDFEGALTWTYTPTGGGYDVVQGGVSGQYANPAGDTSYYLTIPKYSEPGNTGSVEIEFGSTYNYFGLYWGSIDTYNYIEFFNGSDSVGSYSGATLPAPADADGNWTATNSNLYVNFYGVNGELGFDSVVLSSEGIAFEVDNIAVANVPVPEPATMLLFGLGILGLAGVSRRKK